MKKNQSIALIMVCFMISVCQGSAQIKNPKPRTIITTDGEVDDQDSFIRFLLYANECKTEGLIYSSSEWHYKGDGKGTEFISEMPYTSKRYGQRTELRWPGTEWMQQLIDKYAMVYSNLLKHNKDYPSPAYLKSIIKTGNIDFEGEMTMNTEGSELIKKVLLDENPEPVYLQVWGGTNTIARALKTIEDEYKTTLQWNTIYKKVSAKAILYTVLDQDATYLNYVAVNWPGIRVMYNSAQFWSFAYSWPRVVPEPLQVYLKGEWFAKNIKFNRGPLLANYFLWGDGLKIVGDPEDTQGNTTEAKKANRGIYDFISEGDSPAFLYLIDVGLQSLQNAAYGGLGGRMVRSEKNQQRWEDGPNVTDYNTYSKKNDDAFPQTRWIAALQNDFAARAAWCVFDYKKANHPPIVKLGHPNYLSAMPGTKLSLAGNAIDPDNDKLTYNWWQYKEAGTCNADAVIQNANTSNAYFIVPKQAKPGQTIHIILEVSDSGTPVLTRYQRVIVEVK